MTESNHESHEPTRPLVLDTRPEVRDFVRAVRARLVDLTEEEREELVGGLDADMSDLVAERGVDALPDPTAYATELRSAAGFAPEPAAPRGQLRDRTTAWLDRGGATWRGWVESKDHLGLPAFAHSLRPAWWLLRALCATALVMEVWGSQGVFGLTLTSLLVALVFSVVSVQIGRGAWWPGTMLRRSLTLRLVIIGLNVFAVAMLPVMFDRFLAPRDVYFDADPSYTNEETGLVFHGRQVGNLYAYDAQGHPLVGVQLVDETGRRLSLESIHDDDTVFSGTRLTPWMNGRTELYSVFPLPEQTADPDTGKAVGEARLQTPPFASLPPVTLAGVRPSVLVPAPTAAELAARKAAAEKRAAAAEKQGKRSGGR